MLGKISLFAAAALLVGGIGYASAQSSSASGSPSSAQTKCFDHVSGQIKDKTAANNGSSNGMKNGSSASNAGGSASSTTGSASSTASKPRPPAAAGLPDC